MRKTTTVYVRVPDDVLARVDKYMQERNEEYPLPNRSYFLRVAIIEKLRREEQCHNLEHYNRTGQ